MHTRKDRTGRHRIVGLVVAMVSLMIVTSVHAAELLVSSDVTDEVLRYDGTTGAFLGVFVTAGSGGLDSPRGLVFGPDGALYVSSGGTDQVLRYDGTTGAFRDAFVTAGSGGLNLPSSLVFGPDGALYIGSGGTDEVLRYDGTTGGFRDAFVTADSGGLITPIALVFGPDGALYVSSHNTNQVLRYDGTTGAFRDAFVTAGSSGLNDPTFLTFRPSAPSAPECPEDADAALTRAVDPEGDDATLIGGLPTHLTLQEAVNHANDGEVIGLYGRSTAIVLLSGPNSLTITQCAVAQLTAAAASPVVHITGTGTLTIISLDTVGGTIGWRVDTDGHDLNSVRATGASQVGILVVGDHNRISYNAVRSSVVGIRVAGSFNDLRGVTVEGNAGAGVQLTTSASGNTFRTANVQLNGGNGIEVEGPSNTVRDNGRVNQTTLNGILVTGDRNTLLGNRSETGKGNGRHGIEVVAGADTNQLTSNQMHSNAFDGVHVFGTGTQVKGNSANVNVGVELRIGPGNVDQGGNKANGRACTFGAAGGTCN